MVFNIGGKTGLNAERKTMADVIKEAIDAKLVDLHTSMPAIVQSYDKEKQKADVQPVLKRKFVNSDPVDLPIITNVPVIFPRTGKAYIHFPLKKDDVVMLIFAERSVDRWLDKGGLIDPADPRKHNLSDAFAVPGGYPFSDVVSGLDDDNIILENDKSRIEVSPNGT